MATVGDRTIVDLDKATQGLNNDDYGGGNLHNDKKTTTLIGAASEIQQYSVFEKEQQKNINADFFTIGKVIEFFKIGFNNGFFEGIILINLMIFFQTVYPTFKEYFLEQEITNEERLIWFCISYVPMLIVTVWLCTLARFYHGSITKKATLSLLTGRTIAFLAKSTFVYYLFGYIYYLSMNNQEFMYDIVSYFTFFVDLFLPDDYLLTNEELWNYYTNYILPSLKVTTINTYIALLFFALLPYVVVISVGIYRVVKQVKGVKEYEEY